MRYSFLIDYLVSTAGVSVTGLGAGDERVSKLKEAEICDAFERYIVGDEDDEGNDFFKMGDGDVPYIYNGMYYEKADDVKLKMIVKKAMDAMGVGIVYIKNSYDTIVKQCLEGLMSNERCRFVPDRRYVVFKNCVLDTETGELSEHNIKYKTDVVIPLEYKSGTRSGLWDRFIQETIPNDGMRRAFQQFCGGFLVDRTKYKIEYICLMVGSGRNGKSVACEAISGLFGSDLVSNYNPEQLFKNQQSMYNLADIDGKLANYADDVSNKDFSGGDFKQFTSGAKFMARHIYGRPFTVTRVPLMMCCVNEIPSNTDDTNGYYRRLLPILCPNQVADADVDTQLPIKLSTEECKVAIFNWIYDGYKDLIANQGKITVSEEIRVVKESIKEDSNSARRWIRESGYIPVTPTGKNDARWQSLKELMSSYKTYCVDYSETPKTGKSIMRVFKELGFVSEKRGPAMWLCVGIREQEPLLMMKEEEEDLPF